MSFEILEQDGSQTVFAPLNSTIDADNDYYSLTGLDACACNGQPGLADRRQLLSLREQLGGMNIGLPSETVARMRSKVCGCKVRVRPDGSVPPGCGCNGGLNGTYQDFDMPPGMSLGESMDEPGHGEIHPLRVLVMGGVMIGMWWAFKNRFELGWG